MSGYRYPDNIIVENWKTGRMEKRKTEKRMSCPEIGLQKK